MAQRRSTIEVVPAVRRTISVIAKRRRLKVKVVSNELLLFGIQFENLLFAEPNKQQ